MNLDKVYEILNDRIKKYEKIIDELKDVGATENCIRTVIQDYESVLEIRYCIMQEELKQ